ncbi:MAG TPA: prepilin-type N-terminal cleavage/methylation domain-containing protein [Candidatus Ozemobacteraceae bacterium]|mgnify:CR=1 FL=1|nr:prepilin-type N-terminal cleavage/methylation domain-containing protein [Candidatus Ozemobacteraceae bacterium]
MKIYSATRGFTLPELLVGLGIMSFLAVAFFVFLQSSSRQSAFSAEHFTGVLLAQKVVEDVAEEATTNPHAFLALGMSGGTAPKTPIIEGQSTFFSFLEDRYPPLGKIDPAGEGTIDANYGPLYGQVKDFTLGVSGNALTPAGSIPENQHLSEARFDFSWKAKAGTGQYSSRCLFFTPISAKPVSNVVTVNPNEVDAEICKRFFRSPGGDLTQLTTTYGGDRETIRAIGTICVVTQAFTQSVTTKTLLQKQATLQSQVAVFGSNQSDTAYQARRSLAETTYEIAKLSFQVCHALQPSIDRLQNRLTQSQLGQVLWTYPNRYCYGLQALDRIYKSFVTCLPLAAGHYRRLLDFPQAIARGPREFQDIVSRVVMLERVTTMVPELTSAMTTYRRTLEDFRTFSQGRNPFLNRFVMQEKQFALTSASLADKHPHLAPVKSIAADSMVRFQNSLRDLPPSPLNPFSPNANPSANTGGSTGTAGPGPTTSTGSQPPTSSGANPNNTGSGNGIDPNATGKDPAEDGRN